jgi:hypothetical protein
VQPLVRGNEPEAIGDRRAAANAMRLNALRDARRIPNPKVTFGLASLFNLPQVIAVAVVLGRFYATGGSFGSCTWPLDVWSIVYASTMLLQWLISAAVLREGPRQLAGPCVRAFLYLHEPLNLFNFAWFVVGNFWLFDSKSTCAIDSPVTYKLCFALMIINYIVILLPCVLLVCMIPVVFCCFPQMIQFIQWTQSLFRPPRGASEDILKKLPLQPFVSGMFPSDDDSSCVICTESYQPDEPVRILPCHRSHHFHQRCVDEWLTANATCPFCKKSVLDASGSVQPSADNV